MRLGLHALGIGAGADRAVIDAVALAAERAGFATLWSGEHVVMVDRSASRYPYSDDGQIAVPSTADWIDPLIGLSFAAAATSSIGLATGVLLLPEHNPVVVAKQAATLDSLSGRPVHPGYRHRMVARGVRRAGCPVRATGRAHRRVCRGHRTLWRDEIASFDGEFVSFDSVRVNPKPFNGKASRVVCGGNSDAALRRAAAWGDGWYGFNLDGVRQVAERIAFLRGMCAELGRDRRDVRVTVALRDLRDSAMSHLSRTSASTNSSSSTLHQRTRASPLSGCRRWPSVGLRRCVSREVFGRRDVPCRRPVARAHTEGRR